VRSVFQSVESELVEPGWEERWRSFHRPVHAGGLWIGPPWETPPPCDTAVVIDPGRAFGTGGHPTTRACIELLSRTTRGSLLDAGCGSGVLAIAGARLGFAPVVAVDLDPLAVEAARENASRNGVTVDVLTGDVLAHDLLPSDVVVANLELASAETLLGRLPHCTAIVSGYFVEDELRASGWRRIARVELDGWAADSLIRA
jgi:ribosomal protein L11 methyltransferase